MSQETQKYWKYRGFKNHDAWLQRNFDLLLISADQQIKLEAVLAPLKTKGTVGRFHYEHSIRVADLCRKIGKAMGLDQKALFYAGLLHDAGKALIQHSTLGKQDNWTKEDSEIMKSHVLDSWKLLRDQFNFSAEIIIWHHRFQPNCYPETLPPPLAQRTPALTVTIEFYGRLLMMADVFDALHRVNYINGERSALTGKQIYDRMLAMNPDLKDLVKSLYEKKVFQQVR